MALYKIPGYETGQRWTTKPGNLEGDSGGDIRECWGLRPNICLYIFPLDSPLKIPRFHPSLSISGLLHTRDIYDMWGPGPPGYNNPRVPRQGKARK
jgi:hypothetical protein